MACCVPIKWGVFARVQDGSDTRVDWGAVTSPFGVMYLLQKSIWCWSVHSKETPDSTSPRQRVFRSEYLLHQAQELMPKSTHCQSLLSPNMVPDIFYIRLILSSVNNMNISCVYSQLHSPVKCNRQRDSFANYLSV